MNLLQQFIGSPYTEKLGWCLLHSLWQIALIGLVLKVTLDLLGHRSSSVKYNLGMLALLVALMAPVMTWFVLETPQRQKVAEAALEAAPFMAELPAATENTVVISPELNSPALFEPVGPKASDHEVVLPANNAVPALVAEPAASPWAAWLTCTWLAGMLLFSLRPLIGISAAARLRRVDRSAVPEWVQRSVIRLSERLGIRRQIRVSHSGLVKVPTLVGLVRPVILLPVSSLTNLSTLELEAILLHELAHVKRLDPLFNLLQTLIETLLFFHPVVWWISTTVRSERENCCDDIAVGCCGEAKSLVRALVTLEEQRNATIGLAGLGANGGSLVSRIKRLADPGKGTRRSAVSLFSTLMVVAIAATLTATLAINSLNAGQRNRVSMDDLLALKVTSVSDLYAWDQHSIKDQRLIHRFWNMFPPEQREQQGEDRENWQADLQFEFKVAAENGEEQTFTVDVGLRDGFRWSVGKGVWLMDSQWPMRYSLNSLIQQSKQESATRDKEKHKEFVEAKREELFNRQTWHREKDKLAKDHAGRWVAIVDGRVLAAWDTFDDCVAAADEANPHASHRFIFRPGIDDQPQEFAHSPWITGQPNWWQLGIKFRADNMITTAADRWVANEKTHRTDADGKGLIELASPVSNADKKTQRRWAVCSGMVSQQLTMIEEDVDQLRLRRFSVPGTARSKTYSTDCAKVHVQVEVPGLNIKQTVIAFVVPSTVVSMDPPATTKPGTGFGNFQIESTQDTTKSEFTPELTNESIPELPDDHVRVLEMLKQANDEYNQLRVEKDTVAVVKTGHAVLTLHQIKVKELDEQLTYLRRQLTLARDEQKYINNAIASGELDVLVWILEQDGKVKQSNPSDLDDATRNNLETRIQELKNAKAELAKRYGETHPDIKSVDRQIELWKSYLQESSNILKPKELIRRYKIKVDRQVGQLEARFMAINEEFKFHFEKAKRLEQLDHRLQKKQEEIDLIKKHLVLLTVRNALTPESSDQGVEKAEVCKLKHVEAATLKATLEEIYAAAYAANLGEVKLLTMESNTLIIVGSPRAQQVLRQLIQKLDVPQPTRDKSPEDKQDPTLSTKAPDLYSLFDDDRSEDAANKKLARIIELADLETPPTVGPEGVQVRVVEELSTIVLSGDPADVAVVREILKGIMTADGQIVSVAAQLGKVTINLGHNDKLKLKSVFNVYDQTKSVFMEGKQKARLEVVRILDRHLAECRVLESSGNDSILTWDSIKQSSHRANPADKAVTDQIKVPGIDPSVKTKPNSVKISVVDEPSTIVLQGDPDDVKTVKRIIQQIAETANQTSDDGEESANDFIEIQEQSSDDVAPNSVQIDVVPELDTIVLKGEQADVERVKEMIRKLIEGHKSNPAASPGKSDKPADENETWSVIGTITNPAGEPLVGAKVWVATGMGSLRRTGEGLSDKNGKYVVTFGPGMLMQSEGDDNVGVQAASVFASLDGHTEVNLCRQGDRLMAIKTPADSTAWGTRAEMEEKLILKGQPVTIDFVMQPAGKIQGYLVDQDGKPMQRLSLSLTGPELPPSSSVYSQIYTDMSGYFAFDTVPVGKNWRFKLRLARLHAEVKTAKFTLDDAETNNWLLTIDTTGEGPELSKQRLTADKVKEIMKHTEEAGTIVRGDALPEEENSNLAWGDESGGLQAAFDIGSGDVSLGEKIECKLVIKNVSDKTIQFESPTYRQGDKLLIWNVDGDQRSQKVNTIEHLGRATWKNYVLEPGQQVSIPCGNLAVTRPGETFKGTPKGRAHPDFAEHFVPYRTQLAPGKYRMTMRAKLPNHWAETGSWKGRLTTGEVEFEVR